MDKAKEILEKQLQLLSELSHEKELSLSDICLLTGAMCEVARQLKNQSDDALVGFGSADSERVS